MNLKTILIISLYCLTFYGCSTTAITQSNEKSVDSINNQLGYPFGTILDLTAEIIDGDDIMFATQGLYLMKVIEVNNKPVSETIILTFEDETGKFPVDGFELYSQVYGKETNQLTSEELKTIEKNYVGKKINVVAYETGCFTGMPEGYFEYQPIQQGTGFYFKNSLVIISEDN